MPCAPTPNFQPKHKKRANEVRFRARSSTVPNRKIRFCTSTKPRNTIADPGHQSDSEQGGSCGGILACSWGSAKNADGYVELPCAASHQMLLVVNLMSFVATPSMQRLRRLPRLHRGHLVCHGKDAAARNRVGKQKSNLPRLTT